MNLIEIIEETIHGTPNIHAKLMSGSFEPTKRYKNPQELDWRQRDLWKNKQDRALSKLEGVKHKDEDDVDAARRLSSKSYNSNVSLEQFIDNSYPLNKVLRSGDPLSETQAQFVGKADRFFMRNAIKLPAALKGYRSFTQTQAEKLNNRGSVIDKGYGGITIDKASAESIGGNIFPIVLPRGFRALITNTAENEIRLPRNVVYILKQGIVYAIKVVGNK